MSESSDCATDAEVRTFLKDKTFTLYGTTNFINFEEVLPIEETLQSTLNVLLTIPIDPDTMLMKIFELDEQRVEL